MLDIRKIKENPDAVKAGMKAKEVDCDEIIYMRDGRVTERGTFDELMALVGDFAQVYNIQQAQRQSVMDYDALAAKSGVN